MEEEQLSFRFTFERDYLDDQRSFDLTFPAKRYPAGCMHLKKRGIAGIVIDGRERVCGPECAVNWAKRHGRVFAGEQSVRDQQGKVISRGYTTEEPEKLQRPSFKFPRNWLLRKP